MASIEKRTLKDNRFSYRVRVQIKGHPVQVANFEKLNEAKKWAQQVESNIRNGKHFKKAVAKKITLAEAIERYIREVLPKKPRSFKNQYQQLCWWKAKIGHHPLSEISAALIVKMRSQLSEEITHRGKGKSDATVNCYMAVLSHIFTMAMKCWEWVENNPTHKVFRLKTPRGRTRFLSEEERAKLLAACRNSRHPYLYLVVVLCLSTGARKMEILGLKWKDVDMERNVITLHETKNGERRLLPLAGHALELIQKHAEVIDIKNELVFPARNICREGYAKNRAASIRVAWENALKQAEINDFRFHDLRHSAASYLAMNGASLAEIAEVLGHKTLNMVKRYAHLSEAHTAKVVESMNRKIFG